MAYADPRFRPVGVFKAAEKYIDPEEGIHSYFITTKGAPITLEMVNENIERSPSKARHKLKKEAPFHTFQRT